MGSTLYR